MCDFCSRQAVANGCQVGRAFASHRWNKELEIQMADEPDNLVLVHLREIRAKLEEHDRRFDKLDKRLDDTHETAIFGVGLAAMANHKLDRLADRTELLEGRVAKLEVS